MAKRKPSTLEHHLGYWLRFVSNTVSQAFADKVAARGVSVAEWVVLRLLFDGSGAAPSRLAGELGMTRGGVTKLVDRLVEKGLVVRQSDDSDGRSQVVSLTVPGRGLVPELAALADQNDAEFFGHLNAGERAAIQAAMQDIVRRHALRQVPVS